MKDETLGYGQFAETKTTAGGQIDCRVRRHSNISIEAEFLAGTDVHGAIQEAKQLAQKLGVAYIKFKFNDRRLSIGQTADLNYCYNQFDKGEKYIVSA